MWIYGNIISERRTETMEIEIYYHDLNTCLQDYIRERLGRDFYKLNLDVPLAIAYLPE